MKLNKSKFDLYINDNIDQILSFHTKDYSINNENFDKWINNHENGPKKEICKLFKKYTRHISYNEFKDTIKKNCDEIIKLYKNKNIIMFIPFNDMKKSNFAVSLLYYYHIRNGITDITIITKITGDENSVIIIADDATYSGIQYSNYLLVNENKILDIIVAIPYISKKAKTKFSGNKNNLIYLDSSIEFNSFSECIKNLEHTPIVMVKR